MVNYYSKVLSTHLALGISFGRSLSDAEDRALKHEALLAETIYLFTKPLASTSRGLHF